MDKMFGEIPNTATLENFGITFPIVGIMWQNSSGLICVIVWEKLDHPKVDF